MVMRCRRNSNSAARQIQAFGEGDLRPDQVATIARNLNVTEEDVVSMNRRLGGDASLNASVGSEEGASQWQDWLEAKLDGVSPRTARLYMQIARNSAAVANRSAGLTAVAR